MEGQRIEPQNVGQLNRLQNEPIAGLVFSDQLLQGEAQFELAVLNLDLDFPNARVTEVETVVGRYKGISHKLAELFRCRVRPQEGVRVEQQPH